MVNPLRGWGHGRDVTRRLHLRLLTVGPYRGHRAGRPDHRLLNVLGRALRRG